MIAIPYIAVGIPLVCVVACWAVKGISWILYYLEEH